MGVLAVLAVSQAACSSGPPAVSKDDVASQITEKMTDTSGNKPEKITCPDDLKGDPGATLECEVTDQDQTYGIAVTVTKVSAGDVLFDIKVADEPS